MQSAIGKGTLPAPLYEKNPNQMYSQVHIVGNPMPISSKSLEPLGDDRNVVYPLSNVPPNFHASTHGKAPSTSSTFLNNSFNGIAPNISKKKDMLRAIMETLHYPHLQLFFSVMFPKKRIKLENTSKNTYLLVM